MWEKSCIFASIKNQPFHRLATTLDYDTSIYGTDYTK